MSSRKRNASSALADGSAAATSSSASAAAASSSAASASSSALAHIPASVPLPLPSYDHNPLHYRLGAIVRVRMLNFMIYNEEEMRPGPGLNLLLGPNGSGKSTVVSAIGIACAGEMKSVGRFDKLSEYVKSTEQRAMVEVEIFRGHADGKRNLIIQRHFDKQHESKSTFYMGHSAATMKSCTKKDVQQQCGRLNIQVNNLCVYLAQFRVGAFAELDAAGLLAETEKAADPKLHVQHMSILEDQDALKKKLEAAQGSKKQADSLESEVKSMEGEMRAQEERAETERRIGLVKRRIPWCQVDLAEVEVQRRQLYKEEKKRDLDAEKARKEPLLAELKLKEKAHLVAKAALITAQKEVSKLNEQRKAMDNSFTRLGEQQNAAEVNLLDLDTEEARAVRSLEKERANLSGFESDFAKLRPTDAITSEMKTTEDELRRIRNEDTARTRAHHELDARHHEAMNKQRAAEAHLQQLSSKPVITPLTKLMRKLGGSSRGVAEKEDLTIKQLHTIAPVHGPLLSLLQVDDPHCASYLETVITGKMTTAWIVENQDDFNTLCKAGIRTVIFAPPLTDPRRPYNLDSIAQYKVHYLDQAIQCPDIVRSALYDAFRLGELVYAEEDLPQSVLQKLISSKKNDHRLKGLFMPSASYTTAASPWTDDIAVRVMNEIRPPQVLGASGLDGAALAQLESARIAVTEAKTEVAQLAHEKHELTVARANQVAESKAATDAMNRQLQALNAERRLRQSLQSQINGCKAQISQFERRPNIAGQKKRLQLEIDAVRDKRTKAMDEIAAIVVKTTAQEFLIVVTSLDANTKESEYVHTKAEVESVIGQDKRLKQLFEDATKAWIQAKKKLEELTRIAQEACDRAVFNAEAAWLANDITDVQARALLDELNLTLARSIVDVSIKDRFERSSRQLRDAQLQANLDESQVRDLERRIAHTKDTWLVAVTEMVKTIDEKFSSYFERIGCQGRVSLATERDSYGITIKVSFRKNVAMQQLSATSQSGGEKSVSTMLYLLCLQEVTNSPFRMVDEINQGMDAANERTVFNQIVRSCEPRQSAAARNSEEKEDDDEEDTSREAPQYFVVTPKLLPDLHYSRRVAIFCVANGPLVCPQREWDLDRYLKIATSGVLESATKRKKQRIHEQQQLQANASRPSQQEEMED